MLKESNRKYLEKYGIEGNVSDDVAEEIKCYRGKLCRYAKTHTEPPLRSWTVYLCIIQKTAYS